MARTTKVKRNDMLVDGWSFVHIFSGIMFAWVMPPAIAIGLLILWEPLEILILSPILAKFGIVFGYETLRNSLSDIVFDLIGVAIGYFVLLSLVPPPFTLF